MADQAPLKDVKPGNVGPRVSIDSPLTEGVFGNLAEFASDCTALAELQAKLAVQDLKASVGQAVWPAVALGVGGVLALASVPVLLMGLAELVVQYAKWTPGLAYLAVAGGGLVLGGLLIFFLGLRVTGCFVSFRRSLEELSRNVAWIKTVLSYSGRTPAHHKRIKT